ncbi:hypothetical protein DFH05DRAFT_1523705 [Lentinula detonsa]|uniref:DH domain-containing protein n=1 Tax=Lentinula detonsa TaxID=2804962 RepID=A0A9W8P209_9AGAR|nr:hypothetical protein DFH05DRAFT_1523705 [Lentinula detonsa]
MDYHDHLELHSESDPYDDLRTYRICSNLQARLLSLPGFGIYFEASLDSTDPVACIRVLISSGVPLCHLFNLLPAGRYPRIKLDFSTSRDDNYTQRLAIARFALHVNQAFECEHFTVNDILSSQSTSGFNKAFNAVSAVLDKLNAVSAVGGQLSLTNHRDKGQQGASHAINNLLISERNHVASLKILEDFLDALPTVGRPNSDSMSLIFPKKMFVFCRKLRIQLECIAQLPWEEQNWGAPFISQAMDMTMNLRIHCVNWILIKPALADLDMETLKASCPMSLSLQKLNYSCSIKLPGKATFGSVDALVLVPFERLSHYSEFLKQLISSSASTNHKYHKELLLGVACIQQVTETVLKAQRKTISDRVYETLKTRIADWQSLDFNSLGHLILEGNLLTRRNDILQNFDVFLFENKLLLCDEIEIFPPIPLNTSRIGRRGVMSTSILPSQHSLYIKDQIPVRVITNVIQTEFRRVKDNGLHIFFELALSVEGHVVSLLYPDHDDMQKWYHELHSAQEREGELRDKDLEGTSRSRVQGYHLPSSRPHAVAQRKRAATYNGTLTDIENGPLPEPLLNVHFAPHRSAFVKLHFGGNSFVLSVPLPVEFDDLLERIDKKFRHFPRWNTEGRTITHTSADGHVVSIGPKTPLDTIFQERTMISLWIK